MSDTEKKNDPVAAALARAAEKNAKPAATKTATAPAPAKPTETKPAALPDALAAKPQPPSQPSIEAAAAGTAATAAKLDEALGGKPEPTVDDSTPAFPSSEGVVTNSDGLTASEWRAKQADEHAAAEHEDAFKGRPEVLRDVVPIREAAPIPVDPAFAAVKVDGAGGYGPGWGRKR